MTTPQKISIGARVHAPMIKVWETWNAPEHIMQWNSADPGWHCPSSENDLQPGGRFRHRMEARDGSFGFDFEGIYDTVEPHKRIAYTMGDGRTVVTDFSEENDITTIETVFDAETENDPEFQQQGWQAILNNFVRYTESLIDK